jgi:divalent metal cation (Fe/Co/Zn/Cd) transporter
MPPSVDAQRAGLVAANALRASALSRGIRLEILTVSWMAVEGALALVAGIAAASVLLTAFGFDSIIELISGVVVLRYLYVESGRAAQQGADAMELRANQVSAGLLVLLCIYVVVSSVAGLAFGLKPEGSLLGVVVAAAAVVAMPLLAIAKTRANQVINSASLRADIAESITCAYMAAVTLAGIAASTFLGVWWIQYIGALALLIWLVPETKEALEAARARPRHLDTNIDTTTSGRE